MSGGAGLHNSGQLTLNRVAIVGNRGDHDGAGVDNLGILTGLRLLSPPIYRALLVAAASSVSVPSRSHAV